MRSTIIAFLLFTLLILAGGMYKFLVALRAPEIKNIQLNAWNFQVEVADSVVERARGLSGRVSMPENRGMLFIFDRPGYNGFWMRGMLIPLDIVWIKGDRVVWIDANIPADSKEVYYPVSSADKVLEINAGLAEKIGIRIGQQVSF